MMCEPEKAFVGQDLSWQVAPGQVLAYESIETALKRGHQQLPQLR
jgi:hypothetical protein